MYEERSLGVYDQEDEYDPIDNDAHWNRPSESRVAIWGKYLTRHARKQLSFGIRSSSFLTSTDSYLVLFGRHVVAICVAIRPVRHRGEL